MGCRLTRSGRAIMFIDVDAVKGGREIRLDAVADWRELEDWDREGMEGAEVVGCAPAGAR